MDIKMINNVSAQRFETTVDGSTAVLEYALEDGTLTLVHTGVPPALEGRGIGGKVVRAALEYAQDAGLKVIPECPFVRSYIERHKEYEHLL